MFRLSAPTMVLMLGGKRVETTLEHPFYVEGQGWTPAQDLVTGQCLAGMNDEWTTIDHIDYTRQTKPVFNLRIAADHTYFVGTPDWDFSLWVHNAYSVRKLADGTYEVFDTATGQVVENSARYADEATALQRAKDLNAAQQVAPPTNPAGTTGGIPGNAPKSVWPGATTPESVAYKLRTYLLDLEHPVGGNKATWFKKALGFTQENLDDLAKQIQFDRARAVATELTQHGQKYEQVIEIVGANGRKIPTLFVWIENTDGVVRLVTSNLGVN